MILYSLVLIKENRDLSVSETRTALGTLKNFIPGAWRIVSGPKANIPKESMEMIKDLRRNGFDVFISILGEKTMKILTPDTFEDLEKEFIAHPLASTYDIVLDHYNSMD